MKRLLFLPLALLAFTTGLMAQVSIHDGFGTDPDGSAMLDVQSTVSGMLVPRMTEAQRNAITGPVNSLLIYQTDNTPGYYYYDQPNTTWQRLFAGSGNPVMGSGATDKVAFWTSSSDLGQNINFHWDDGNGRLGIGNAAPSQPLHVTGNARVTGNLLIGNTTTITSGRLGRFDTGTAGAPSYSFSISPAAGMYLASVNEIAFSTNSTERMRITGLGWVQLSAYSTNGIVRTTGGNGTLSSTGGGIDLTSEVTGVLPVANGGTGTSTQNWVDLSTTQTAAGNKTWTGVATFSNATSVRLANGTAALPAVAFTSDPNTGVYRAGTDILGFSTAGAERLRILANGTVRLPSYTTNGIVRATGGNGTLSSTGGGIDLTSEVTGVLPVANGGTGASTQNWVDLTTAQTAAGNKTWTGVATFSNATPVRLANGTAALPAVAFTSDPNTGVYSIGADVLGFSTAGAERMRIGATGNVKIQAQTSTIAGGNINNGWLTIGDNASSGIGMDNNEFYFQGIDANFGVLSNHNLLVNVNGGTRMTVQPNGVIRLNNYTTNGIVRTTGANGTLSSTGGAINLASEVTGVLPVANGGTGSSTQNWVDLTTNQTAAGDKTWSGVATFSNTTPVRASNGTAALPAYSYTSDPNTGMLRPGADILAFATNGTERMRIASNGTVQVGVTTAQIKGMDVRATAVPTTTRYGIDNRVVVSNGSLNAANRTGYGIYNAMTNNNTQSLASNGTRLHHRVDYNYWTQASNGKVRDVMAAYNYVLNPSGGEVYSGSFGSYNYSFNNSGGISPNNYGAYNYGRNRGTMTTNYGAYNYAHQDLAGATSSNGYGAFNHAYNANGTMTNGYGAYNYTRNNVGTMATARGSFNRVYSGGGAITNAYGVQSSVERNSGTITTGYLYYGSYSGTVGTKWGMYITGEDKNYFSNNVGIGVTSPTYNLHVNGRIRTNAINETSDVRLKKNITDLKDPLGKVLAMRGVNYHWRTDEFPDMELDSTLQFGLIAQELEAVVPELVHTDSEGWKSIEYGHIVPLLIEAIKELKQENAQLHSTLDRLVLKVEQLDHAVNASGPSPPSAAVSGP